MEVVDILASYGFSKIRRLGNELNADCVFCGQARKFWFNVDKGVGVCFRGCWAGSLEALIVELEGCTRDEARAKVGHGVDWFADIRKRLQRAKPDAVRRHPLRLPAVRSLDADAVRYFEGRGVESWALDRLRVVAPCDPIETTSVFWDCEPGEAAAVLEAFPKRVEDFAARALLPVRNGGDLAMIEARATNRTAKAKALYPRNLEPRDTLLGLELIDESVEWLVVVEGSLDVLSVIGYGFPVVGTWGAGMSREQAAALLRFRRVYLAFDGDKAGRDGTARAVRALADGVEVFDVRLPTGTDPNALGRDGFGRAFVAARKLPAGFRFPKPVRGR